MRGPPLPWLLLGSLSDRESGESSIVCSALTSGALQPHYSTRDSPQIPRDIEVSRLGVRFGTITLFSWVSLCFWGFRTMYWNVPSHWLPVQYSSHSLNLFLPVNIWRTLNPTSFVDACLTLYLRLNLQTLVISNHSFFELPSSPFSLLFLPHHEGGGCCGRVLWGRAAF